MRELLDRRGLWLWVGAAMLAPMAQWLGSSPWPWTLAVALGVGVLFLWTDTVTSGYVGQGKVLPAFQLIFLALAVGVTAAFVGKCWQTTKTGWTIPVVLLTLAACAAGRSNEMAQRAGATMFWFVGLGFVVLMTFVLPDVNKKYLYPGGWSTSGGEVPVLLIPGVVLLLPRKKGKSPWLWVLILVGAAVLVSLFTAGVLSSWVAAQTPGAFLEMVRGVRVLGVAERLESLVAAIMTLSWFSLLSMFLSAAGEMGEHLCCGKRGIFVWCTAGLGAVLHPVLERIPVLPIALGGLFLWYVIPAGAAMFKRKKR